MKNNFSWSRRMFRLSLIIGLIDFMFILSFPFTIFSMGLTSIFYDPFQSMITTFFFIFLVSIFVLGPLSVIIGWILHPRNVSEAKFNVPYISYFLLFISIMAIFIMVIPKGESLIYELLCFGHLLFPVHFFIIFGILGSIRKYIDPDGKRYNLLLIALLLLCMILGFFIAFSEFEFYYIAIPLLFLLLLLYKVIGVFKDYWFFFGYSDQSNLDKSMIKSDHFEASSRLMIAGVSQSIAGFIFLLSIIFIVGTHYLSYDLFFGIVWLFYIPSLLIFFLYIILRRSKENKKNNLLDFLNNYLFKEETKGHILLFQCAIMLIFSCIYGLTIFISLKNREKDIGSSEMHIIFIIFLLSIIFVSLPHSFLFLRKNNKYEFFSTLYSLSLLMIGVLFLAGSTTDILFFETDRYEDIELVHTSIPMLFAMLPLLTIIPTLMLKRLTFRKTLVISMFSFISIITMGWVSHRIFVDNDRSDLITVLSLLLFFIPLSSLILIGWLIEGVERKKGKIIDVRWLTRGVFSRPIILIIVIICSISLNYIAVWASWTSYDIRKDYPEGEDMDYVRNYLEDDLSILVHEEAFHNGDIYDPNILNLTDLRFMEQRMREMESKNQWGHHHLEIDVSLKKNVSFRLDAQKGYDAYYIDHYYYSIMDITIDGDEIYYEDNICSYLRYNGTLSFMNTTGKWGYWKDNNISLTINNIDIIKIEVDIGVQSAPLAGYGGNFEQWIAIENEEIIFILSNRSNWVS